MPYIITTTASAGQSDDVHAGERIPDDTRRAVATLDEARDYAWKQAGWTPDAPDTPGGTHDIRRSHGGLKEATGGTIGPLPDGTLITVERVEN